MDALALAEDEGPAGDGDGLGGEAADVDLDAALDRIVEGLVGEAGGIEGGAELAVHAAQQVEGEGGGDARRIVVGVVQAPRVLAQVDAQHQRAAVAQQGTRAAQEGGRLSRFEIADGRAGKKAEARRAVHVGRQGLQGHVVGAHRLDAEPRIVAAQAGRGGVEMLARDVDRHVGREVGHRLEQQPRLDAGAAAELDQGAARPGQPRLLARTAGQDPGLGAGEVILRQLADGVEQFGAPRIVEELRRDGARRPRQAGMNGGAELVAVTDLDGVRSKQGDVHRRSSASRMPPNIHRASGGKKLR